MAAVESRLFRRLLLFASLAVTVMWWTETLAGYIKPWNSWLYPILIVGMLIAARMLHIGGVWDMRGRIVAVASVNFNILGTNLAGLYLGIAPVGLPAMSDLFWLPMAYTATYAALPALMARRVVVPFMVAFTLPVLLTLVFGAPASWPVHLPSMMLNVVVAQLLYVPLLTGIARIRDQVGDMHQRIGAMHSLAMRDELTGLANRRAAQAALAQAVDRAGIAGGVEAAACCAVMLIDLDHFKRVNDGHGHAEGDRALVQVAQVIASTLRASDLAARWGGEEFVVVARELGEEAGLELAERVRRAVAGGCQAQSEPLTISVGVAFCRAGDTVDAVVSRADGALYRAKEAGRNTVRVG